MAYGGRKLPIEVAVDLPSWLPLCDEDLPDSEWIDVIGDQLLRSHGHLAHRFGWRQADSSE
jgi:hypothetical protein